MPAERNTCARRITLDWIGFIIGLFIIGLNFMNFIINNTKFIKSQSQVQILACITTSVSLPGGNRRSDRGPPYVDGTW